MKKTTFFLTYSFLFASFLISLSLYTSASFQTALKLKGLTLELMSLTVFFPFAALFIALTVIMSTNPKKEGGVTEFKRIPNGFYVVMGISKGEGLGNPNVYILKSCNKTDFETLYAVTGFPIKATVFTHYQKIKEKAFEAH